MTERIRDLAHLSHVELFTPKPNESLAYFRELLGMEVAGERGDSVYLRGFGDYERSSLKLTAAGQANKGKGDFPEYVGDTVMTGPIVMPAEAKKQVLPSCSGANTSSSATGQ